MAKLIVDTSTDAGAKWEPVEVGPVGGDPITDADSATTPHLCLDEHDDLWLVYHDDQGRTRGWYSQDQGQTWVDQFTLPGLIHPRMEYVEGHLYLAAHTGTALRIYRSVDYGETWGGQIAEFAPAPLGPPEAPFGWRVDRWGWLHLVSIEDDGTRLWHRYTRDGETFPGDATQRTLLAEGTNLENASLAIGVLGAVVAWFEPAGLAMAYTDPNYRDPVTAVEAPADLGVSSQAVALLVDGREQIYLAGRKENDTVAVRFSADDGHHWAEPS